MKCGQLLNGQDRWVRGFCEHPQSLKMHNHRNCNCFRHSLASGIIIIIIIIIIILLLSLFIVVVVLAVVAFAAVICRMGAESRQINW